MKDPILHTETLDRRENFPNSLETRPSANEPTEHRQTVSPGLEKRTLQGLHHVSTKGLNAGETIVKRRVLSTLVLPLGVPAKNNGGLEIPSFQPRTSGIAIETPFSETLGNREPGTEYASRERDYDQVSLRQLSSKRVGSPSWLIHERLGREPQRQEGTKHQCGARAFLLASWDEGKTVSSELVRISRNTQSAAPPSTRYYPLHHMHIFQLRLKFQSLPDPVLQSCVVLDDITNMRRSCTW